MTQPRNSSFDFQVLPAGKPDLVDADMFSSQIDLAEGKRRSRPAFAFWSTAAFRFDTLTREG